MKKKLLVMGLPGAGKTFLSKSLSKKLDAVWLNADKIRKEFNDWDFSLEGRLRQSKRMNDLADENVKKGKICNSRFCLPYRRPEKILMQII